MEYDFFDEQTPNNDVQRVPAPAVAVQNPPPRKKIRWWHVLLAVGVGIFTFLGGYFACWFSLDSEIRTLVGVKKEIQQNYYKEVTDEEFYGAIFDGINQNLLDDYSGYMTPEQYAEATEDLQGNRSGLGIVFNTAVAGKLRVVRVCGGSPAEDAGIVAGDYLVGYGRTESELVEVVDFDSFADFLAGYQENESLFLKVRTQEEERVVSVSKKTYVENYVFYRTKTTSYVFLGESATTTAKGAPMPALAEDTAYIRLAQFTGNAAAEFKQAMAQFKLERKKHLVLDLRGNGGGLLDVMQSISSYFCKTATEERPVVAIADYGDRRQAFSAQGNYYKEYFAEDSRICVLADSDTASASECLIGCMVDYGALGYGDICLSYRGKAAKTFGKGIMQETYILNYVRQDALKLTTAEIRWPKSNHSIHGRGVLPEDGTLTVEENYDFEQETAAAIEKLFA